MFTKIVVAVDGSKPANNALRIACDIAKHYESEIHIVHTPQVDTAALGMGASVYTIEATMDQIIDAGRTVAKEATALAIECGVKPTSTVLGRGSPSSEILTVVNDVSADLIVCGRRGLGNLSTLILGSTSKKISHDADCAVLTVK
jgi:nucleotide-binding universal stress UspA family protein